MNRVPDSFVKTMVLIAWLAAGMLVPLIATAADKKGPSSKGFVDGSAFRDLAGDDAEVVEVNLGGTMLQVLSGGKGADAELGGVLRGLHSIQAFIVNLEGHPDRFERAMGMAADLDIKLRRQGWEPLVTVRQRRSRVNVLALSDDATILGLVVMSVNPEEGEAVFVNIAGIIDLARLGELSKIVDVPGLESLGDTTPSASGDDRKHPSKIE